MYRSLRCLCKLELFCAFLRCISISLHLTNSISNVSHRCFILRAFVTIWTELREMSITRYNQHRSVNKILHLFINRLLPKYAVESIQYNKQRKHYIWPLREVRICSTNVASVYNNVPPTANIQPTVQSTRRSVYKKKGEKNVQTLSVKSHILAIYMKHCLFIEALNRMSYVIQARHEIPLEPVAEKDKRVGMEKKCTCTARKRRLWIWVKGEGPWKRTFYRAPGTIRISLKKIKMKRGKRTELLVNRTVKWT